MTPSAETIDEVLGWFGDSKISEGLRPCLVYHQTTAENADSIRQNGFDMKKVGARIADEHMPDGIFFKPTREPIGGLGTGAEPVQMRFCLSLQNPFFTTDRESLEAFLSEDKEYASLLAPIKRLDKEYEDRYAIIEDKYDAHWPPRDGQGPVAEGYFTESTALSDWHDAERAKLASGARARALAYLHECGFDGLVVEKDVGSFGRELTSIVAFDTRQVRPAEDILPSFGLSLWSASNWTPPSNRHSHNREFGRIMG